MDLLELNLTDAERAEAEKFRSQLNVARATFSFRIDNGLTQAELARLAETTQARVSDVEAMKGDPKLSTLARIARALGCMIDMVPMTAPVTPPGYSAVSSRDLTVKAVSTGGLSAWGSATLLGHQLTPGQ